MTRVKGGISAHKTHKNLLKLTRGYRGTRNNLFRQAKQASLSAGIFAYRDRRVRKRQFRARWITTINIALAEHNLKYSTFMHDLKIKQVGLNRKVLAEMIEKQPDIFKTIVGKVKQTDD